MPISRYESVQRVREKRIARMREYKAAHGCRDCGERDPCCLEVHHRDPSTKHPRLKPLGFGRNGWSEVALRDIDAELAKCDVLCCNCHRKRHVSEVTG